MWEIRSSTPLTNIYFPNEYYYKVPEGVYKGSYILGTELKPYSGSGYKYYAKKDVARGDSINNYLLSYSPATYYYRENGEYILDNNNEPSSDRVYYKINDLYVIEDTTGNFAPGAKWNSNVTNVDDGITLGTREEVWELQELKGFARNYNTIHGLILRINQMLEADNLLTRDLKTVQGSINTLNDIIHLFSNLNPEKIAVTDKYGRITTTGLIGDDWIKLTYKDGSDISITHKYIGEDSAKKKAYTVNGEPANKTLDFGGTFVSPSFELKTDDMGHLNKFDTSYKTLKMPTMEYIPDESGNVMIDLSMSAGSGANKITFTQSKVNVGALELADYLMTTGETDVTKIEEIDSINTAFAKINTAFNSLDYAMEEEQNVYVSKVEETNGIIEVTTASTSTITSLGTVTSGTWDSTIAKDRVTTLSILNSAVTTEKIADGGITEAKLANLAVTTGKIAEGAITTNKINSSAITTDLINNSAVTLDKIATNAISTDKIIDDAVTSSKIKSLDASKITGTLNIDKITEGNLVGSRVVLTEYVISNLGEQSVSVEDTVNEAIAKLEKRIVDLEDKIQTLEGTNSTT